jgi:hypothetical protein
MVYFSLRIETREQKNIANATIEKLKKAFGEDEVEVTYFEVWASIEMPNDDIKGWVGVNDVGFGGKSRFHLYKNMGMKPNINLDIPLEQVNTIYNM